MSVRLALSAVFLVGAPMLLASCSSQQVMQAALSPTLMQVALSGDPKAAVKHMARARVESYKRDPRLLFADFERLQAEMERLFGNVRKESEKQWGAVESGDLPSAKRYVKYTEQYKNRIIVDYERGYIRIEHLQDPQAAKKVRDAVVVALLTPDDPKATDVFSDKEVSLEGRPFLQTMVNDQSGKPMQTRADVERFADWLVSSKLQTRRISVRGQNVEVAFVQFDMIGAEPDKWAVKRKGRGNKRGSDPADMTPDAMADGRGDPNNYRAADKVAPRYLDMVNKYAAQTGVDPALIFAIIYQESRFNPHAVSSANAYGMMQLVPRSGGIEAYRRVKGENVQPTKEYLMDPENNIELGSTYVKMLLTDHWMKGVTNMAAREYCAISAYNTGPGNLSKAFTGSTGRLALAREKANAMRPDELFDHLRGNLPYHETRDYLVRVSAARKHYREMFYSGNSVAGR